MAQRRIGCGQTISVSPCQVRHRRRAGRLDRVGKLRGCGISGWHERKSRLVRPDGRRGPCDRPGKRLRGRLRPAPTRLNLGRNELGSRSARIVADVAADLGGTVADSTSSSCRRSRCKPRSGRHPRASRIRARASLDRNVLHRGPLARHHESLPRGGVRCRSSRCYRQDPPRRKLVLRGSRFGHERRRGCPDQSPSEGTAPAHGSAAARASRLHSATAQQGRRRGRPRGPRLEHELGTRVIDGESGDRRPPRRPRNRATVRGGLRRGLGGPAYVRTGCVAAREPVRPPRIVRARRGRLRDLPAEIETGRQRHKTLPAGANACPLRSCSPPRTWRSSATVP